VTRLLIVNADDFGLTRGVSHGILRAHREGIVTSTSVLAVAPAFAESASWLRDASGLGIGVHLAVVGEDPPLTLPARIPSLVGEDGRFAPGWRAFLRRSHRVRPAELEEELAAQIETARGRGLAIDHLDSHQHLHLLPRMRDVVLRLAARFRIRAVRVTGSGLRRPSGIALRWLARGLAKRARGQGLFFPARSDGFDRSGRMNLSSLVRVLDAAARADAPSTEIFVHPGERDDADRSRYAWGYDWAGELEALVHPDARAAVLRAGFRLGTYRDLPWEER
jgi:predicted glycoside hydrolase/deacetylase ChbG (UPF0249 family)